MGSKIEQIIEEIEEYIEGCKYQALSTTKILVEKEHIDELLRELRMRTPDEIKRYQKIISNKEAILKDAQDKADAMIASAQAQKNSMVSENEIMQQAYEQANEVVNASMQRAQQIIDDATMEANNVKNSAMQYMDDMLAELQNIITHAIDTADSKYGGLIGELRECDSVIKANRSELYPQVGLEKDMSEVGALPTNSESLPKHGNTGMEGINLDILTK